MYWPPPWCVILCEARKDSRLAAQQRAKELEELSAEEDETSAFTAYDTVAFCPRVRRLFERLDAEASHVTFAKMTRHLNHQIPT
jgi:predicted signal transduction protein with EAL and GGDEF domain